MYRRCSTTCPKSSSAGDDGAATPPAAAAPPPPAAAAAAAELAAQADAATKLQAVQRGHAARVHPASLSPRHGKGSGASSKKAPHWVAQLISSGQVDVSTKKEGKVVATLNKGDYFGDRALVSDEKRAATCTAKGSNCQVLAVDREDFVALLGSIEPNPNPT